MIRWTYLITRFLILALILAAIWIGKDPLVRYALICSGESVTGAKIEIGQIRSSIWHGKIYLRELAIADPRSPMHNLFQADIAYMKLDPKRLLHRELVIEHGTSSQVLFGAPRTSPGSLDENAPLSFDSPNTTPTTIAEQDTDSSNYTPRWDDQFTSFSHSIDPEKLELKQVAHQKVAKWPRILKAQRNSIQQLQNRFLSTLKQVKESAKQSNNPLRDKNLNEYAMQAVELLQQDYNRVELEIAQLQVAATQDSDEIRNAKIRDLQRLGTDQSSTRFNAEDISNALLAEYQEQYTNEVLRWFKWFRDSIPDPQSDFGQSKKLGVDIVFDPNAQQRPRFLIKELELDGEGRIAGQHFNFSGVAQNITTEPKRHSLPTTFNLQANGQTHLYVDCTIDRRNDCPVDSLSIKCPGMRIPAQILGTEGQIAVNVAESRLQSDINVSADDDNLSGTLVFRLSDLLLQIDKLEIENGKELAKEINLDLATLNRFEIKSDVSGTFDAPVIQFRSDLGQSLATVMNRVLENRVGKQGRNLQESVEQVYETQMSDFNRTVLSDIEELRTALKGQHASIAGLSKEIPKAKNVLGTGIKRR